MNHAINYIKEQVTYLSMMIRMSRFSDKNNMSDYKLGMIWEFVNPMLQIIVYYLMFGVMMRRSVGATNTPYLPWMIIGMAVWQVTSGVAQASLRAIINQFSLANQMNFPKSILPTTIFISRIRNFWIWFGVGVGFALIYGYGPTIYWAQVIYYVFAVVCFTNVLSFFNAVVSIVYRDYIQVYTAVFRVMMWVSGVMMDLQAQDIPTVIRQMTLLNPFYYLIEGFRDSVFSREWFWQKGSYALFFWCLVLLILVVASNMYDKYKESFRDYL